MKVKFAIIVAGRGVFPASLISQAKEQLFKALKENSMEYIVLPDQATETEPCRPCATPRNAPRCSENIQRR